MYTSVKKRGGRVSSVAGRCQPKASYEYSYRASIIQATSNKQTSTMTTAKMLNIVRVAVAGGGGGGGGAVAARAPSPQTNERRMTQRKEAEAITDRRGIRKLLLHCAR